MTLPLSLKPTYYHSPVEDDHILPPLTCQKEYISRSFKFRSNSIHVIDVTIKQVLQKMLDLLICDRYLILNCTDTWGFLQFGFFADRSRIKVFLECIYPSAHASNFLHLFETVLESKNILTDLHFFDRDVNDPLADAEMIGPMKKIVYVVRELKNL